MGMLHIHCLLVCSPISFSTAFTGAEQLREIVRGQGMNHCILDVSNLMDSLLQMKADPKCQELVIGSYEKELISRGQEEVQISVKTAMTVHDWDQFMNSPLMKHGVTKMGDLKTEQ